MTNPILLALTTSSGTAQMVACLRSGEVVFSFSIVDYAAQSEQLLPQLQSELFRHGVGADQVVGFAVDIGPGGFTSLRTACGIAQGLALAWSIPCFPISSFECLFEEALAQQVSLTGAGLILLDARLNQLYAQTGASDANTWKASSTFLLNADEQSVLVAIHQANWCLVSPAVGALVQQWAKPPTLIQHAQICAVHLAKLAWVRYDAGQHQLPIECQPLYVREKVADTTAERLAKKHNEQD